MINIMNLPGEPNKELITAFLKSINAAHTGDSVELSKAKQNIQDILGKK